MDATPENPWSYVLMPTGAALIIAVFYRRGLLDADALEQRPRARLPFTAVDLLPVAAMWVAGAIAASALAEFFRSLGGGAPITTQPTSQPATQPFQILGDPGLTKNLLNVLLQIVIQLPMMLFVFWALLTRGPDDAPQPMLTSAGPPGKRLAAGLHEFGLFRLDAKGPFPFVKMGIIALLAALPIVFGINQICIGIGELFGERAPESGHKLLEDFGGKPSTAAFAVLLVSVTLVAPVLEEFVYRGLLQSCLRGLGARRQTVIIAAAIFAIVHASVVPLQVIPGLFALGLMLGWLYERTGSLLPGIVLHGGFNLANVVLYYLVSQAHTPTTQPAL